jgi:hypothetical protein
MTKELFDNDMSRILRNKAVLVFHGVDEYMLILEAILEAISRAGPGTIKVITDDMDYAVVPGIQVFTANRGAIQQAKGQDKLIQR